MNSKNESQLNVLTVQQTIQEVLKIEERSLRVQSPLSWSYDENPSPTTQLLQ